MKYYRDVDYFIYFEDFPHMGIPGAIMPNSDGTVNIFINTLYSQERQRSTIRHELRHFVRDHLYCDWKTIEEKESEADNDEDDNFTFGKNFSYVEYKEEIEYQEPEISIATKEALLPNVFAEHPEGTIPIFASLNGFGKYMFAMREQNLEREMQK